MIVLQSAQGVRLLRGGTQRSTHQLLTILLRAILSWRLLLRAAVLRPQPPWIHTEFLLRWSIRTPTWVAFPFELSWSSTFGFERRSWPQRAVEPRRPSQVSGYEFFSRVLPLGGQLRCLEKITILAQRLTIGTSLLVRPVLNA